MMISFSPQPDDSLIALGEYRSDEYGYHLRVRIAPGQAFDGLTWDELVTLAAIETDDDGRVLRKLPRTAADPAAVKPAFLRAP